MHALQVLHSFHPVSPEEYDATADYIPLSCPLRALGDTRSGRQLLAETDTDTAIKIGSPRCTAAGAGRLERVAAAPSASCARGWCLRWRRRRLPPLAGGWSGPPLSQPMTQLHTRLQPAHRQAAPYLLPFLQLPPQARLKALLLVSAFNASYKAEVVLNFQST